MDEIGQFCLDFASKNGLKANKDEFGNVVIFKPASKGYENADTVMLQGHMDIVCQKETDLDFDFEKQGLDLLIDGEFVTANGTTLGADNGIAMAMAMAILEDNTLSHPAIEAVFTVDEEIGLIGASKLDCSSLKSKKMINIDSEDPKVVIVSCAGGCDVKAQIPLKREEKSGKCIKITLDGLKGGHSGAEIDKGRINADILAGRILNHLKINYDFDIISLNGGDKGNAIPKRCEIELLADETVLTEAEKYLDTSESLMYFRDICILSFPGKESMMAWYLSKLPYGSPAIISWYPSPGSIPNAFSSMSRPLYSRMSPKKRMFRLPCSSPSSFSAFSRSILEPKWEYRGCCMTAYLA